MVAPQVICSIPNLVLLEQRYFKGEELEDVPKKLKNNENDNKLT